MKKFKLCLLVFAISSNLIANDDNERNEIEHFLHEYIPVYLQNNFLTCRDSKFCENELERKYYSKIFVVRPPGEHPIHIVGDFKIKNIAELYSPKLKGTKGVTIIFNSIGEYNKGDYKESRRPIQVNILLRKEDHKWKVHFQLGGLLISKSGAIKMLSIFPEDRKLFEALKKEWGIEDFSN